MQRDGIFDEAPGRPVPTAAHGTGANPPQRRPLRAADLERNDSCPAPLADLPVTTELPLLSRTPNGYRRTEELPGDQLATVPQGIGQRDAKLTEA
jgi:hypothetical protein